MGYPVHRGGTSALDALKFLMVLSSDHITGATGKTPTVTILKTGAGSFATPAGSVSELGSGWYQVAANPTDLNTLGPLLLHATATACDPRDDTFSVVDYQPSSVLPLSPPTSASFGTVTARDLIRRAFDNLGISNASDDAGSVQDAFQRLNQMVALWATQPLTMLANKREVFDLVADTQTYTIGPGGDFDTVRPIYLTGAGLLLNGLASSVELPVSVLTEDAFRLLQIKTQQSTQPQAIYYSRTQPLGTIKVWPVQTTALNDLVLYSDEAIAGFSGLSTQYTFAPGYAEFIEYSLTRRLAPPYGRPWTVDLQALYRDAAKWIKTANTTIVDAWIDPALTTQVSGVYNILSDQVTSRAQ